MSFTDILNSWWKTEQKNWTLQSVTAPPSLPAPAGGLPAGQALQMHMAYVTVRMRSMAITSSRAGWSAFHAALHCEATLGLRNGDTAQIQAVLAPDFLRNLDAERLQQVLHIDRTVFGPMPYIGGPLGLNMGVFAVKHADLAAPFLNVLEDLASTAGVAFISAATPFVGPIKKGMELLTGTAATTSLEIGMLREYEPPVTGWYALVRLAGGTLNAGELSVSAGNFELLRQGQPMPKVPYLVYSIDGATLRPDFARIPELKAAYAEFSNAVQKNKQAEAKEAVNWFSRMARISPELLRTHVDDVIRAVSDEYDQVFPDTAAAPSHVAPTRSGIAAKELRGLEVNFRTPV